MSSINDVYSSTASLKADDLPPDTQVPVKIETVTLKEFDGDKKLELRFVGKETSLLCNLTNAKTIAKMLGMHYDAWPGHTIKLMRTYTDFKGDLVPCIRVVPDSHWAAPAAVATTSPAPVAPVSVAAAVVDEIPEGEVPF